MNCNRVRGRFPDGTSVVIYGIALDTMEGWLGGSKILVLSRPGDEEVVALVIGEATLADLRGLAVRLREQSAAPERGAGEEVG